MEDYPIEVGPDDMSLSLTGDLLITGPAAEKIRRWLVNYPRFYPQSVVPYIRVREPSFRPDQVWIDPKGRIHITNPRLVERMRRHLTGNLRKRPREGEP